LAELDVLKYLPSFPYWGICPPIGEYARTLQPTSARQLF